MSINHAHMATHAPQSLPSFAQAFSTPSLNSISTSSNSLPPIQGRLPSMERHHSRRVESPPVQDERRSSNGEAGVSRRSNRKRGYPEGPPGKRDKSNDISDSDKQRSPRLVRIKEEQDHEMLDRPSPPLSQSSHQYQIPIQESTGAPPPSSLHPHPPKRRRVTISGPHSLNTNVPRAASEQNDHSTPLSPVVMGFTLNRDDPTAIEQVRSMLSVKQKQKALIEQRRGSVAGLMSIPSQSAGPPSVNVVNPLFSEERDRLGTTKPQLMCVARSPPNPPPGSNANVVGSRRAPVASTSTAPASQGSPQQSASYHLRQPSPASHIVQNQPPPVSQNSHASTHSKAPEASQSTQAPLSNTLPPPPISFARRRAGQLGGMRKKPADILISPRDPQMQPMIQSAPPIPRASQQSGFPRFPMTLPSLPPVIGAGVHGGRRMTVSQVPPTPTRLGMPRSTGGAGPSQSGNVRSPQGPSVPIASTLVPPTPTSLAHPNYLAEKSAFLNPFEAFYDALADSKQLKNWLGEQLQKSQSLMQNVQQQQGRMEEMLEAMVDKKVEAMRDEIYGLRRRVGELEEALHATRMGNAGPSRPTFVHAVPASATSSTRARAPSTASQAMPDTQYTFPPVAEFQSQQRRPVLARRPSSTGRPSSVCGDMADNRSVPGSERGSPVGFEINKRVSVSAMRYDPAPSLPPMGNLRETREGHGRHSAHPNAGVHDRGSPHSRSPVINPKSAAVPLPHPALHRANSYSRTQSQQQQHQEWDRDRTPMHRPRSGQRRSPDVATGGDRASNASPLGRMDEVGRRNSVIMSPAASHPRSPDPMDEGS